MEVRQLVRLDDEELKPLLVLDRETKISLYMPVQQEPDKRDENRIRLKNLIQAAEENLDLMNFRRPDSMRLLSPARELIKGGRFLDNSHPGMAIFLADGFSQAYKIPYEPPQIFCVCAHYQIKPIMPLKLIEPFYILVLSQQSVRLLQATEFSVERLNLGDAVPDSLDEALHWDDPEKQLQWHTGTGSENGGRSAIFHGHGVATKESQKTNLYRYFQLLDQGISRLLTRNRAPILLAGVDYLLPIYREASSNENLFDREIIGSQEHLTDMAIQKQAWPLVRNHFRADEEAARSSYHEMAAKDLASDDLISVVKATYQGRVETLFVDVIAQEWGEFNPDTGQVAKKPQRQPGATELTNLATIYTVLHDGDVYAGQREAMPTTEAAAAIYRF